MASCREQNISKLQPDAYRLKGKQKAISSSKGSVLNSQEKPRGDYKCGRCGFLKRGHECAFGPVLIGEKSFETTVQAKLKGDKKRGYKCPHCGLLKKHHICRLEFEVIQRTQETLDQGTSNFWYQFFSSQENPPSALGGIEIGSQNRDRENEAIDAFVTSSYD